VLQIRFTIRRIHLYLGFPDPHPDLLEKQIRILPLSRKNSKKNIDSYCFVTSLIFLSLKNYINVPSKSNKKKNLERKKIIFS
jgi:hypothetical protein